MGQSQSKKPAPPMKRLPQKMEENPSSYPGMQKQHRSFRQLDHLEPFFSLKARVSEMRSQKGYPQGEIGFLARIQSQPVSTCPSRPLSEAEFHRLTEIIKHQSEMGTMREETSGLSHHYTLHSYLQVAEAYYHLGQYDKAQPLLEQVYILSDEGSHPEFTVQPAEMLNFIYLKTDFKKNMRALEKKSLAPPPRRRK